MPVRPNRGDYDDAIAQSLGPGTKEYLEFQEMMMTPTEKKRPRVTLERDKEEWDYPHTRKYNYVKPDMTPKENAEEYLNELMREGRPPEHEKSIRKRGAQNISNRQRKR